MAKVVNGTEGQGKLTMAAADGPATEVTVEELVQQVEDLIRLH